MKCPHCEGDGGGVGLGCGPEGCGVMALPCLPCGSTGEVSDELGARMLTWRVEGRRLRELRNAADRSLREEARHRGISVVELSQMERGVIVPVFPPPGDTSHEPKEEA